MEKFNKQKSNENEIYVDYDKNMVTNSVFSKLQSNYNYYESKNLVFVKFLYLASMLNCGFSFFFMSSLFLSDSLSNLVKYLVVGILFLFSLIIFLISIFGYFKSEDSIKKKELNFISLLFSICSFVFIFIYLFLSLGIL
ncbi:MAG: hypothetical protein N2485_01575 [bacterium]|nr:hypothetical protein [bacterium]